MDTIRTSFMRMRAAEYQIGCGQKEERLHYVRYKVPMMKKGQIKRKSEFLIAHKKIRTAQTIYTAFMQILDYFRNRGTPPNGST